MIQYSLEKVSLSLDPRRKRRKHWQNPITKKWTRVEKATLGHFQSHGWSGYAGEGELILNLIKTMSFRKIPDRHRRTFIEALYAQNVAFDEDLYDLDTLLNNVRTSTKRRIRKNFKKMTYREWITYNPDNSMSVSPDLTRFHLIGLFKALGNKKISDIAKIFAADPYKYRSGWPDLTLWKGKTVAFREVKTPNDKLQKSQRTIIEDILKPLGLNVAVVKIEPVQVTPRSFFDFLPFRVR